jgi:hypothetical protein
MDGYDDGGGGGLLIGGIILWAKYPVYLNLGGAFTVLSLGLKYWHACSHNAGRIKGSIKFPQIL